MVPKFERVLRVSGKSLGTYFEHVTSNGLRKIDPEPAKAAQLPYNQAVAAGSNSFYACGVHHHAQKESETLWTAEGAGANNYFWRPAGAGYRECHEREAATPPPARLKKYPTSTKNTIAYLKRWQ
ncbi:MAG TPA: hypothetical protein VD973_24890 [Symbiobacteriaceae bacterium]|nr:hypothetical protein [Symbiobacteriaceae bacterium]